MLDEIYEELKDSFSSAIRDLKREMGKVRTGRANAAILDGIKVDYYGSPTPLNQVGTVKVVDPRLITITPWEKTMIAPIEKAIMMSDLGLNPANDGALVRVPIPQLTGERRQELVRLVKRSAEDHKIVVRNHRRDANDMAKSLQKDGEISEDDMHRALKKVQGMTDEVIAQIDAVVAAKEAEILEV